MFPQHATYGVIVSIVAKDHAVIGPAQTRFEKADCLSKLLLGRKRIANMGMQGYTRARMPKSIVGGCAEELREGDCIQTSFPGASPTSILAYSYIAERSV